MKNIPSREEFLKENNILPNDVDSIMQSITLIEKYIKKYKTPLTNGSIDKFKGLAGLLNQSLNMITKEID